MKNISKRTKGSALTTVIIFFIFCTVVGVALYAFAQSNFKQSRAVMQMDTHYYAAESAVQLAAQELKTRVGESTISVASITDEFDPGSSAEDNLGTIRIYLDLMQNRFIDALTEIYEDGFEDRVYEINGVEARLSPWGGDPPIYFETISDTSLVNFFDNIKATTGSGSINMRPHLTLSATSAGREVSVDLALTVSGFVLTYNEGSEEKIDLIKKILNANAGTAYFKEREGTSGLYSGTNVLTETFYKKLWPCATFDCTGTGCSHSTACACADGGVCLALALLGDDEEEPEPCCACCDPSPTASFYARYRHFQNFKQAEYQLMIEAMNLMFEMAPTKSSFFPPTTPARPNDATVYVYKNGAFNWEARTGTALTINAAWANNAANADVEYLFVPGNLTISGNVNLPNLQKVYVGGGVIISNDANFNGSAGVTDFLVEGLARSSPAAGMVINMRNNNALTINNAQFYVKNNIALPLANNSSFLGNGIYISYNGRFDMENGNTPNITIGAQNNAPQFYAKNGFTLGSHAQAYKMYGIFGTPADVVTGIVGGSTTPIDFTGLFIGNINEAALKGSAAAHEGLGDYACLDSAMMQFLEMVAGGKPEEETGTNIPEENAKFTISFLHKSGAIDFVSFDGITNLRETTGR